MIWHIQYKDINGEQCYHWRFFETPEVVIIGISVLFKYGNQLEIDTSEIGFIPQALEKSKFVFKFICLATIYYHFITIKVKQKCQYCQLREFRKKLDCLTPTCTFCTGSKQIRKAQINLFLWFTRTMPPDF